MSGKLFLSLQNPSVISVLKLFLIFPDTVNHTFVHNLLNYFSMPLFSHYYNSHILRVALSLLAHARYSECLWNLFNECEFLESIIKPFMIIASDNVIHPIFCGCR